MQQKGERLSGLFLHHLICFHKHLYSLPTFAGYSLIHPDSHCTAFHLTPLHALPCSHPSHLSAFAPSLHLSIPLHGYTWYTPVHGPTGWAVFTLSDALSPYSSYLLGSDSLLMSSAWCCSPLAPAQVASTSLLSSASAPTCSYLHPPGQTSRSLLPPPSPMLLASLGYAWSYHTLPTPNVDYALQC